MIILTVIESEIELIAGIPESVQVTANIPANIYYTFDGEEPDENSLQASSSKVIFPTDQNSFTFKCVAFDGYYYSETFEKGYTVSSADIKNTRKGNEGGLVIFEYGQPITESFTYDSDGFDAQEITKIRDSVDFKTSVTDDQGIPVESTKSFINFAKTALKDNDEIVSSPNNDNVNFDPRAKVVIIDGSSEEKMNNQSVRIINRPYDAFEFVSPFYKENESKFRSIISGNLVRYVYNNQTGEVTFYYYESVESRWIISKQKTDPKSFNFGKIKYGRGNRFVFRWVADPVMSKLR